VAGLDPKPDRSSGARASDDAGQKTGARRPRLVLHPILFAAFPVVFLWAHNVDQGLDFDDVVGPLLLALALAAGLWALLTRLLRDSRRAGIIVSVLALMFFSFGYVAGAAEHIQGTSLPLLLAGWCVLAAVGIVLVLPGGDWVPAATKGFNVAAVVLIGLNLFTIVWAQISPGASNPAFLAQGAPTLPTHLVSDPPSHRPDIYYIIFDEYGGPATMRDFFGYSEDPLMRWLRGKGFDVPAQSATNYPRTELSIASSMNLRYLTFLTQKLGPNTGDIRPINTLLAHAQIGDIMKSLGYDYIHIGSWWELTRKAANADVNLVNSGESDFSSLLLQQTAIGDVTSGGIRSEVWRTTQWELWNTEHLDKYRGPRFVFTHILCPHGPLVFARNGSLEPRSTIDREGEAKAYANQHYWVDQQIKQLVTSLQDRPAGQQPIIVLQADEGPYPGEPTEWPANPDANQLEMKFDIMNAYYLPGVSPTAVWPTITPVNTFRMILDEYFHAGLAHLPDREYTFADLSHHLYEFRDVTDRVHDAIWGRAPAPRPIPSGTEDLGS
jgi:Sulfatase